MCWSLVTFLFSTNLQDINAIGPIQINENTNNAIITTFQTTDEDPSHTHTYSLVQNPGNKFKMLGSRLMTTATANLNYEQQSTYSIVVRTTDSGSPPRSFDKGFTVKVLDLNEVATSVSISTNKVGAFVAENLFPNIDWPCILHWYR